MKTAVELQDATRRRFPAIAAKADELHIERWNSLDPAFAYSWFENLADALNQEMAAGVPFSEHHRLFEYLSAVFPGGTGEVRACIDVAFTENLFWEVEPLKTGAYWQPLPQTLKDLYVSFHQRAPL